MSSWRSRLRVLGIAGAMVMTIPLSALSGHATSTARAAGTVVRITGTSLGATTVSNTVVGQPGQVNMSTEFAPNSASDGGYPANVNRFLTSVTKGNGRPVTAGGKAKSNPAQIASFEGLNHYMSRSANNGNQFSQEPPDQALCAGNGYVVEGVNDAIAVYQRNGTAGTLDTYTSLNQFYGFAPAIDRTTGIYGPEVTDPVCYFDPATQHFFFAVLTLDFQPNGSWDGTNHLDIAVSQTANPLGNWNLYRLDVTGGANGAGCPCLADYPKIGADSNGIYITTDDFPLAGPGLNGGYNEADIYAFSKQDLLGGHVDGWLYSTSGMVNGDPGYVVWPTTAPDGKYEGAAKGTEYFLSTTLDACSTCSTGSDNRIAVWALTDTSSISSTTTAPVLSNTIVNVAPYVDPPNVPQKAGDNPTGQVYYGVASGEVGPLATNDAGSRGAVFANGKLWGTLNTGVIVGGQNEAGVEYYAITPHVSPSTVGARLDLQGTLALPNQDLIFPSIGVTPSGRGIMSFTLTGPSDFPSAAYASVDDKVGAGAVTIAAAGQDSQDGFSEYQTPIRPRWGDYGATAVDGNVIWMGSEYIAHACTLETFQIDPTCGHTRSALANWSTRVTAVDLHP